MEELRKRVEANAKYTFDIADKLSADDRILQMLDSVNGLVWNIILNPEFNQFEYGLLTAYLGMTLALSAGLMPYEQALENINVATSTYVALSRHTEVSEKGQQLMAYYLAFGGVQTSD